MPTQLTCWMSKASKQSSLGSKFASQPYTIVDGEWKGDDFVQIAYTKEGSDEI